MRRSYKDAVQALYERVMTAKMCNADCGCAGGQEEETCEFEPCCSKCCSPDDPDHESMH